VSADLIVQKYGGSSLGSPERLREIAGRIATRASRGTRMVVTVSAMGRTTDDLLALASEVAPNPSQRELDMLLTVGERISMALLSMALNSMNCPAISFTGSQCGILTNVSHNRALIEEIRGDRIREELAKGRVVIVAGFQGVSRQREITTLGRGGSDTTAVALAVALGAVRCEIYSDFPGVFTADPRWIPAAHVIDSIGYDEMLELAALGATVLHYRAADMARRYHMPLHLAASSGDGGATRVGEETVMEKARATSVTCNTAITAIRIDSGDDGALQRLLERLTTADTRLLCYQRTSDKTGATLHLVVAEEDAGVVCTAADELALDARTRDDLGTVSLVGSGLASGTLGVYEVEKALADAEIHVAHTEKSALSITCLVPRDQCKRAVEILHSKFLEKA
jgi:aspartate kinase